MPGPDVLLLITCHNGKVGKLPCSHGRCWGHGQIRAVYPMWAGERSRQKEVMQGQQDWNAHL
jgi:hypothetical protein